MGKPKGDRMEESGGKPPDFFASCELDVKQLRVDWNYVATGVPHELDHRFSKVLLETLKCLLPISHHGFILA